MDWLRQPFGMVKACLKRMSQLEAIEALSEIQITAAATGHIKQEGVNRMMRRLKAQANGPSAPPQKPRFDLAELARSGVGVRVLEVRKDGKP